MFCTGSFPLLSGCAQYQSSHRKLFGMVVCTHSTCFCCLWLNADVVDANRQAHGPKSLISLRSTGAKRRLGRRSNSSVFTLFFFCFHVLPPGCIRPPGVQHGDLLNRTEANRGSFLPGSLLTYGCEPGYTADGPTSIICTSLGVWSRQPPRCIRNNGKRRDDDEREALDLKSVSGVFISN